MRRRWIAQERRFFPRAVAQQVPLLVDKYEMWVRDVTDHRYAFPTMSLAAGAQARNTSPNHRLARIDFEPEFGRQSRRIQFGFTLR